MTVRVYLEIASRRVFASALDWPGWCRSARNEDAALDTLASYAPRYAAVAADAGMQLPIPPALEVIERVPGDGTTDFGAPNRVLDLDRAPLSPEDADRLIQLVRAAWEVFDSAVAGAPAVLPKGPRGGGRDRDAKAQHVFAAEAA